MLASALRQGERIAEWRTSTGRIGAALAVVVLGSLACEPNRNADANRDGAVTPLDVALVAGCIGADPAALAHCTTSDVDGDGDVDAADLALVERRAGLALPALASSDPAAGATAVARTAWLRLDFAEPVESRALATLALACDGSPRPFSSSVLAPARVVVNPSPDMPANASCVLAWAGPSGSESLAFETAEEGAPATVYYDRTDLSATAPFPDDYWLVADPSTLTGHRVALAAPDREPDVVQLFTSLIQDTAQLDGFSPLALITAGLSDAPDPASLPMTVEASADPLASVGLFDLTPGSETFGARIPFQLHVRNDDLPGQPTAHSLVAFPSIPLTPGGRYGFVVTRRALADPTRPFDPSPFLAAAAAPATADEDAAVAAVREVAQDVLDGITAASPPIPAADVALALRITVRDTSAIPRDLLAMKAQVLAEPPAAVTVTSIGTGADGVTTVNGTWQAPDWRSGGYLARDAAGLPRITRRVEKDFTLHLPARASDHAVPVVVYQGSHHDGPVYTLLRPLLDAGFAVVATPDGRGAGYGLSATFAVAIAGLRLPDWWTQSYGDGLAFLRALESLAGLDVLPRGAPDGRSELDLSRPIFHSTSSHAASAAQAILPYAPEVRAAVLAGGGSRMAEQLFHRDAVGAEGEGTDLLGYVLPRVPSIRAPEVWVALSLFQMLFDPQDPHNHAAFLHRDPIEVAGTRAKASLLIVESVGDRDVPNQATRSLAWTAGALAQLSPWRERVPFLVPTQGSASENLGLAGSAAFAQYSCLYGPPACALGASLGQQVAFFLSALGEGAPTILAGDTDTDEDGLPDVREPLYRSDPANPDSDDDGLRDGLEVDFSLDPANPADAHLDADGDGLDNAAELALGTNLRASDTDGDALSDSREVALGSNPLLVDTDGGGAKDADEVEDGTDLLVPDDDRPVVSLPYDLYDGDGFQWRSSGGLLGGASSALSSSTTRLHLSNPFGDYLSAKARVEDLGREIVVGPVSIQAVRWTRKLFVPADDGFARVLEILENSSSQPRSGFLWFTSSLLGSDVHATYTSDGDTVVTAADDALVRDDAEGSGYLPITHVFSGLGARVEPGSATTSGSVSAPARTLSFSIPMVVPPRGRAIAMYFVVQSADGVQAVASAEQLRALGGSALAGLSSAERKAIVNFSCAPDADEDGLLDFDEAPLGTDPANPDSDGDGLLDGFEVDHGFEPTQGGEEHLDPDGDGADNLAEQRGGGEPHIADTDEDTLLDGVELDLGTDPTRRDTDADGLSDAQEVSLGTDPLDAAADADGDGLTDVLEILSYRTDPFGADTDGDGLADRIEIDHDLDPTDPQDVHGDADEDGIDNAEEIRIGTGVWVPDTDADELLDGAEVARGTDPFRPDTDGGGRSDGTEVWRDRSDPLDPSDEHQVLTLPFDFVDGSGRLWTIDADGELASDAWSSIGYPLLLWAGAHATKAPAEHRVVLSWPLGQREVHYPPEAAFVRILDVARNGPNDESVYLAEFDAIHRSGLATEYVATSSGGPNFALDDDWVVLDDADGSGIPAAVIVREGEGSTLRHEWSYGFGAELGFLYWLEPDPGERVIVMTFLAQSETRAEALAIATTLHALEGVALDGLDAATRAAIVNFSVPPP